MHTHHIAMGGPDYSVYPAILRISTDSPSTHPLDTQALRPPGALAAIGTTQQVQRKQTSLLSPLSPCLSEHKK